MAAQEHVSVEVNITLNERGEVARATIVITIHVATRSVRTIRW